MHPTDEKVNIQLDVHFLSYSVEFWRILQMSEAFFYSRLDNGTMCVKITHLDGAFVICKRHDDGGFQLSDFRHEIISKLFTDCEIH